VTAHLLTLSPSHPVIIVSPWYGPDTAGGAETQARQLAQAMAAQGAAVEVWSSTGRDAGHPDDTAHYPEGYGSVDGIRVRRFRQSAPGDDGVPGLFRRNPRLLPALPPFPEHEMRLLGSLLSSDDLLAAIAERGDARFIFVPYPFPTSFWGSLLAPGRAWLLPCLHDEPYARYGTYRHAFASARGVLCNSHGELALASRLYGLPPERLHMAGEGIALRWSGDGERFRRRHGIVPGTRLLLSVARRDVSKNLPLLLAYAREYWASRGEDMRLVLLGPPAPNPVYVPRGLDALILDAGFVSEQEKHDAYAAADVLVHPSLIESFSIVLMEGWLQGAPALVHSDCEVTRDHVERSGGGLHFATFGEFAAALDLLLPHPERRAQLGARGRNYVLANCRWEDVARRTLAALQ
jgi:glycosyltransferase involved in cell wall biosynthesis